MPPIEQTPEARKAAAWDALIARLAEMAIPRVAGGSGTTTVSAVAAAVGQAIADYRLAGGGAA